MGLVIRIRRRLAMKNIKSEIEQNVDRVQINSESWDRKDSLTPRHNL